MARITRFTLWMIALVVSIVINGCAQEWKSTAKVDPLTGKSYTLYVLMGKFLTPPSQGNGTPPSISLRCDPSSHHSRISGKFIDGFIIVNTIIDIKNGDVNTVQYRLDDGKLQTAYGIGYSTDYRAISLENMFLDNLLWGHMIPHKPHTNDQVHKVVIAVQEHLAGQIVMEFDMPDAEGVGAACGTEYK
jgi:hypothetical protein